MPFSTQTGPRIYWKLEGCDEAPALVLLNSIGTDMGLWADCLPHLRKSFRVLTIDTRGHGASDIVSGDYTLGVLASDVFGSMDAAGLSSAAIAGVSLGGMIAMEMALSQPERCDALALICTSATMDKAAWADRVFKVRTSGMPGLVDVLMGRFLSQQFTAREPAVAASIRRGLLNMDPAGYSGCAAAIRDMDIARRITAISQPTAVMTGDLDSSTPLAGHGDYLLASIAGSKHVGLSSAHLAPLEAPETLVAHLTAFFAGAANS